MELAREPQATAGPYRRHCLISPRDIIVPAEHIRQNGNCASARLNRRRCGSLLGVGHMLKPVDGVLTFWTFLHRNMRHASVGSCDVPVFLSLRDPNPVARNDNLRLSLPDLDHPKPGRDIKRLLHRMRMLGRACARSEDDKVRFQHRRRGGRNDRILPDRAGKGRGRSPARWHAAIGCIVHVNSPLRFGTNLTPVERHVQQAICPDHMKPRLSPPKGRP